MIQILDIDLKTALLYFIYEFSGNMVTLLRHDLIGRRTLRVAT